MESSLTSSESPQIQPAPVTLYFADEEYVISLMPPTFEKFLEIAELFSEVENLKLTYSENEKEIECQASYDEFLAANVDSVK